MDLTRFNIDFATLDAEHLQTWFPAAELCEISARWGDVGALIAYLARANHLTQEEAEETILDLAWSEASIEQALRAA